MYASVTAGIVFFDYRVDIFDDCLRLCQCSKAVLTETTEVSISVSRLAPACCSTRCRRALEMTGAAYAQDIGRFLKKSGLTERRNFIKSFMKEIVVTPDNALMRYTVPMLEDRLASGMSAEDMALNGSVLSAVPVSGPSWIRTGDLSLVGTAWL